MRAEDASRDLFPNSLGDGAMLLAVLSGGSPLFAIGECRSPCSADRGRSASVPPDPAILETDRENPEELAQTRRLRGASGISWIPRSDSQRDVSMREKEPRRHPMEQTDLPSDEWRKVEVQNGHAELVRRAKLNDQRAVAELWKLHQSALFRFLRRQCGRGSEPFVEADEILQEVFLRAWASLGSLRCTEPRVMAAWLRRIAAREMDRELHRHLRHSRVERLPQDDGRLESGDHHDGQSSLDVVIREEESGVLRHTLARLDEKDRLLLQMQAMFATSWETLAFVLDLPSSNAARSAHARARRRLRTHLAGLSSDAANG